MRSDAPLMSTETQRRAEDIFDLMQQRKLSFEEGRTLLQRLQSLIESQDITVPTPTKEAGVHASTDVNSSLVKSSVLGEAEEEEEYSDCKDVAEEKRIGQISPVQFADLRRDIDLYRASRKDILQTEHDLHKEMADIRQVLSMQTGLLQDLLQRLTQSPDPPFSHPTAEMSQNQHALESTGIQSAPVNVVPGEKESTNLGELAKENPHPNDLKIGLNEESGNFSVEVEMESVPAVIRSYCKQFNADEAIANLRSSSSWGPTSKYFNLSDEEIKAQW